MVLNTKLLRGIRNVRDDGVVWEFGESDVSQEWQSEGGFIVALKFSLDAKRHAHLKMLRVQSIWRLESCEGGWEDEIWEYSHISAKHKALKSCLGEEVTLVWKWDWYLCPRTWTIEVWTSNLGRLFLSINCQNLWKILILTTRVTRLWCITNPWSSSIWWS